MTDHKSRDLSAPLAYSTTSRSPCLQRSTPESLDSLPTPSSISLASLPASGSSR
jgi:hypothetical protein